MLLSDYLIPQEGHDWSAIMSDWHWLVPANFTIWIVNRYGDVFLVPEDNSVYMLELGSGTLKRVASNREDFAKKMDEDNNANDWLLIPLVNKCVAAGLQLKSGQCYSYIKPPVLGGGYTVDNTEVTDLSVHYSFLAQIHRQIKDLPDGAKVKLVVRT
jgi:hypothetical protein